MAYRPRHEPMELVTIERPHTQQNRLTDSHRRLTRVPPHSLLENNHVTSTQRFSSGPEKTKKMGTRVGESVWCGQTYAA